MTDLAVHDDRSSRSRRPDPRVHDGPKFALCSEMHCGRPEKRAKKRLRAYPQVRQEKGKRTMKTELSMIGGFCLTMLLVGCGSSSGGAPVSFGSGGSAPGADLAATGSQILVTGTLASAAQRFYRVMLVP